MTNAVDYAENVYELQSDIDTLDTGTDVLKKLLEAEKKALEVPGKLEKMLRDPATAIDLPDPLVTVLGVAPYGIGTAIKTVDRIASEAADVILEQADLMKNLDEAWSIPRKIVSVANGLNTANSTAIDGYKFLNGLRAEEATLLEGSLGAEEIWEGSALAARMEAFNTDAESWFATKDAVLVPLNNAIDALEEAGNKIADLLPDLSDLEAVGDQVLELFGPIKDTFVKIEDAVCVVFTITPEINVPAVYIPFTDIIVTPAFTIPAVTVDICKILEDIGNAVAVVQNFVEGVITSALGALGFDLFAALDDLKAELLAPFQPIFDALAGLLDGFQPLLDIIEGAIADIEALFNEAIAAIEEATGLGPMFQTRIAGDQKADLNDELTGTEAEDGMFGLMGDDKMQGLGGTDFMFGGAGNDEMDGGDKADEMFGSLGNDTMLGGAGDDMMDGGKGADTMNGQGGGDTLFGRAGNDSLKGRSGADVLDGGVGKDKVFGGGGDDDVAGGGGNDRVLAGGGSDTVKGDGGNDFMKGGRGMDLMDGGKGRDKDEAATAAGALLAVVLQ